MSYLTSYPIYSHSGESLKENSVAQQASINEDYEQRRRLLDKNGEAKKKLVAHEVAHLIDNFGTNVHLKETVFPKESLLEQAKDISKAASDSAKNAINTATDSAKTALNNASDISKDALHSATDSAKTAINTATDSAKTVINTASDKATSAASTAANAASSAASTAASTAGSLFHSLTSTVASLTHTAVDSAYSAASTVTHVAQEASHKAADYAHLAVDSAYSAAGAVKEKGLEVADLASNKVHDLADNISHFTTLVGVLAEEENERARRLASGDEGLAAANAFKVSALIRDLGIAFYKQTPNLHYTTRILEESERRWRLNSTASQLAESNAHKEGKLIAGNTSNLKGFLPRYQWVRAHISTIEEKERVRRLNDSSEAWAMINAFSTSYLISQLDQCFYRQGSFSSKHSSYATTLLEENERRDRIRWDKLHHSDNSHFLMDVVNNNLEKFNYTTRHAAQFANEFASLIGSATLKVASQFSEVTKDLAKTTTEKVKSVAGDIQNFSSVMYVIALEEKERARRLSDPAELSAINNAWSQSQLIRDLPYSSLYKSSLSARYPLGLIEEQERAWRVASLKPYSAGKVSSLVLSNLSKFELAAKSAGEREHARDTAVHSRLNPNAPAFVPHQALPAKVEPVVVPRFVASSAQL